MLDDEVCWGVVGAGGFVGGGIRRQLHGVGITVRAVQAPRLLLDIDSTPEAVLSAAANSDAIAPLARELRGCRVVVNAAGMAAPASTATAELFGANALTPVVVALAAADASVGRYIHISSAAVQGSSPVLTDEPDGAPFSPYSASKFLAERALALIPSGRMTVTSFRATSIHGVGRGTTTSLISFARSPFASVAGDGEQPSVVATDDELAREVIELGTSERALPDIAVQRWAGRTVRQVMVEYGGKEPIHLPVSVCRIVVSIARLVALGARSSRLRSRVRRLEVAWFGQRIHARGDI